MSAILGRLQSVDLSDLLRMAIAAAKEAAGPLWSDLKEFAKKAAKNLMNGAVMVAKLRAEDKITDAEAKDLLEEEKTVARIQLRSIIGVGLVTAQNVINAVIAALRGVFNSVIGFALI